MKYALLIAAAAAFAGCTDTSFEKAATNGNGTLSVNANAITVGPASSEQCSAGGAVYTLFIDKNSNGLLDAGEIAVNEQIVCNGVSGASGFSTLFSMTRVSTGLEACASHSGLQINSGVDSNFDHVLQASEILGSQVLCDGANGASGSAGAAGSNGYSMVFQSVAATPEMCPAGGSTIVMALDTNRNNVYDSQDSSAQTITLCNGVAGSNAVLPAYTPVDVIYPCGNTVAYKEVLLRLQNGELLSSFSDNTAGSMTRLTFLPDGTYIDTDNTSCQFSVSTSGSERSISWGGQVQKSWTVSH